METHYADMARRGWMLERHGAILQRYKACEPQETRFCVDVLPDIGMFDYPHGANAMSYRAMCEDAGWELVAQHRQTHVFRAKDAESVPLTLHTDAREQNTIYMRAYRKMELFVHVSILLYLPFLLYMNISTLGATVFLDNRLLTASIGIPVIFTSAIMHCITGLVWYLQSFIARRRGSPPPVINRRLLRAITCMHTVGWVILVVSATFGIVLEIINGVPLAVMLFSPAVWLIALTILLRVDKKIDTQERTKRENIRLWISSSFGAVFLTMIILMIGIGFLPSSEPRRLDAAAHPSITLSALGMEAPNSMRSEERGTSIAVPVNYSHSESNWHGNLRVSTTVQRSVSTTIARWLFNDRVATTMDWHNRFDITRGAVVHYHRLDSAEAAAWGADEVVITITEGENVSTKLRRGRTLVFVRVFGRADVDMGLKQQAVSDLWDALAKNY